MSAGANERTLEYVSIRSAPLVNRRTTLGRSAPCDYVRSDRRRFQCGALHRGVVATLATRWRTTAKHHPRSARGGPPDAHRGASATPTRRCIGARSARSSRKPVIRRQTHATRDALGKRVQPRGWNPPNLDAQPGSAARQAMAGAMPRAPDSRTCAHTRAHRGANKVGLTRLPHGRDTACLRTLRIVRRFHRTIPGPPS